MGKYKFAASGWIWYGKPETNSYDFIDKASRIGFEGVEIPILDGNIDTKKINEKLESQSGKIEAIIVGGGSPEMDVSSISEKYAENGLHYIMKLIEKAVTLNSKLVCGPLYSAVGKALFLTREQKERALSRVAFQVRRAAEYANNYGVDLALEPLNRYDSYLINTSDEMASFINRVGKENVGILLDTFHMNIEETSMGSAIINAGKKLRHLQVCENNRGVPGKGMIDWEEVKTSIVKNGYGGMIGLESFTPYEQQFSQVMRSWRPMEKDQDTFAYESLKFLKNMFS